MTQCQNKITDIVDIADGKANEQNNASGRKTDIHAPRAVY